jgi:hypothetical protein
VPRLQFMLDQLNVHHQIEDLHYFPIFRDADARLTRGFEVLEGDHHHIHSDMARTAETANALLQALHGDPDSLRRCGDDYADASGLLLIGLMRHLDDEEDLIVPLILDRGRTRSAWRTDDLERAIVYSSSPGLSPQVGYTRLVALDCIVTEVGQARLPL